MFCARLLRVLSAPKETINLKAIICGSPKKLHGKTILAESALQSPEKKKRDVSLRWNNSFRRSSCFACVPFKSREKSLNSISHNERTTAEIDSSVKTKPCSRNAKVSKPRICAGIALPGHCFYAPMVVLPATKRKPAEMHPCVYIMLSPVRDLLQRLSDFAMTQRHTKGHSGKGCCM